jgi:hypothetical protein
MSGFVCCDRHLDALLTATTVTPRRRRKSRTFTRATASRFRSPGPQGDRLPRVPVLRASRVEGQRSICLLPGPPQPGDQRFAGLRPRPMGDQTMRGRRGWTRLREGCGGTWRHDASGWLVRLLYLPPPFCLRVLRKPTLAHEETVRTIRRRSGLPRDTGPNIGKIPVALHLVRGANNRTFWSRAA